MITTDKRADSVNEKWPENLACRYKRIYLNACAAHGSFPLRNDSWFGVTRVFHRVYRGMHAGRARIKPQCIQLDGARQTMNHLFYNINKTQNNEKQIFPIFAN